MISVASRWLEWFEYRISGGATPARLSRPNTRRVSSLRTIGVIAPFRSTCRAATPASVRAQSDGNTRSTFGAACSSAERGTNGRRPQRKPSFMARNSFMAFRTELIPTPSHDVRDHDRRRVEIGDRRRPTHRVLRHLERVSERPSRAVAEARDRLRLAADEDHVARVSGPLPPPCPHLKGTEPLYRVDVPCRFRLLAF